MDGVENERVSRKKLNALQHPDAASIQQARLKKSGARTG
jgi:hypothetical protein